jgi:hypothetical protein
MCLEHFEQTERVGMYPERSHSGRSATSGADLWNEKHNVKGF